MKFCTLSELLEYRNFHVRDRYCKEFKASPEKADKLFMDMLKFLWISRKNIIEKSIDSNFNAFIVMQHEMIDIDNMWHTFILFTKDYTDFCNKYFGHYLHHVPNISGDESKLTKIEFEKQFRAFLTYVYDNLGESTLRRWFSI